MKVTIEFYELVDNLSVSFEETTEVIQIEFIELGTQGVPGPQGLKGDTGIQGSQGIQGIKGDVGSVGLQGIQGIQGIQGVKGDAGSQGLKGDVGSAGSQGIQGIKGDTGIQGNQGMQGIKGDTGSTGPTGSQGLKGDTGSIGPTGSQGIQGLQGLQGLQGIQGVSDTTAIKAQLNYVASNAVFDAFYTRVIADGGVIESTSQLLSTLANLRSISYVPQSFIHQVNSDKFVKLGGISEQYLMADGKALSNIATNTTTTVLSLATLNSTYPTAIIGFRVHCILITAGKLIYEKTSTGWVSYSINQIT